MIDNIALVLFHLGLMVVVLRLLRWPDPDVPERPSRAPRALQAPPAPNAPDAR